MSSAALGLDTAFAQCLVGLIAVTYLTWSYMSYQRLRHIPGPRLWGWTILPWMMLHMTPGLLQKYDDLIKRYGPVVRVGPNTIITSDADVARRVGAVRLPYARSEFYTCMRLIPGEDHIFSLVDETRHQDLRKKMGSGYSGKDNTHLESDVDACILDLVNLIERKYLSSGSDIKPMDLGEKIVFFTTDVISKIAFNAKFNNLREDKDHFEYLKNTEELFPNLLWTATVPTFVILLTKIRVLQFLTRVIEKKATGLVTVRSLVHRQVAQRFRDLDADGKSPYADMLGSFVRHGLNEEELKRESMINLTAGTDTTATPIRVALFGIMSSPHIYRRATSEIDNAVDQGKIPSDPNEVTSEQAARELPYIQACIKEALRWIPPVVGEFSKMTPPEGDTISGYQIPGNTKVGFSQQSIHRDPALFNPDPDSFRPERWLPTSHEHGHEPSLERITAMEKNNELIFGHGKFQCLGKPVAFMEVSKVLVELLRRFEFEVVNPLKPWHCDSWGVVFLKDFWVVIRKRELEI